MLNVQFGGFWHWNSREKSYSQKRPADNLNFTFCHVLPLIIPITTQIPHPTHLTTSLLLKATAMGLCNRYVASVIPFQTFQTTHNPPKVFGIATYHYLSTHFKHETAFPAVKPLKLNSTTSSNPYKNDYSVKQTNSQQHYNIIITVAQRMNHALQRLKRNKIKVCSHH